MGSKVLIIDDDQDLCALLCEFLQLEGFDPGAIHDGTDAIAHCKKIDYDAIVLDIMLPGTQGLDVLRALRKFSSVPVLMLTARGDETDRILGLELGADDYLPKPCNPRELSARLRAILRRTNASFFRQQQSRLRVGHALLDPSDRTASFNGDKLALTSAEFNVFQVLLANAGEVVKKETLSQEALGRPLLAYDRSLDVHVSKIRKKLAAHSTENLIVSVRGIGYQFTVSDRDN